MPMLRWPLLKRVWLRPRVMKGPPSSGQVVSTGRRERRASSPCHTTSWQMPLRTVRGIQAPTSARTGSLDSLSRKLEPGLGMASWMSFSMRAATASRPAGSWSTPRAMAMRR